MRLQTAIEQSPVLPQLSNLEKRLDHIRARIDESSQELSRSFETFLPRLDMLQAGLKARIDESSQELSRSFETLLPRLDMLQAGLEARIDESSQELSRSFETLLPRLDMLQVGLDRLLIDRYEFKEVMLEKLDRQKNLLDVSCAAQTEISNLMERLSSGQAEDLQLSALLLSRTDYFLHRITIPLGRDIVIRTPEGLLLLPSEDPVLVTAVWESGGRLEPGTIKVCTAILREGDHTIDVGASVGITVLSTVRQVGATGRVIALEPGSRARGLLRQTLALNFLSERVLLYSYAAGEAPGTGHLNLGQVLGHSSLLAFPGAEKYEEVEIRTIDTLVPRGVAIRLAKLDVEGFEPQAWRGMQRVIAENPGLVALVEFRPEHLQRAGLSIEDWLTEFRAPGFTPYEVDETTGNLRQLRPVAELASVHSLKLLLLRQPPTAFPELHFE